MTEIIPFPARPLRVIENDKPVAPSPSSMGIIRSFITAMGSSIDPLKIKQDIHVRQGTVLESWVNESVEHLGHDVVIEMLENMTLHLMQEKRK